jgi:hypothetical protein
MRIISDFKDYYDSAQGFGIDPAIKYVRKQDSYSFEKRQWPQDRKPWMPRPLQEAVQPLVDSLMRFPNELREIDRRYSATVTRFDVEITVKLVGFCGYFYPMFEIGGKTFHSTEKIETKLPTDFLKEHGLNRKKLAALLEQAYERRRRLYWRLPPLTHGTWRDAVSEFSGKRFDDVFVVLGVPVFKLEYTPGVGNMSVGVVQCTFNPFLKAERFQRIMGPAEAFQEIAMYVGNQLAHQPDPVSNISDEILRDEKGFNDWSFRRHKEESKKFKRKG